MRKMCALFSLLFLVAGMLSPKGISGAIGKVVAYPAIPGLTTSDLYSVKVNGVDIWTEKILTHLDIGKFPDWFLEPYTRVQQEVHQASFSCKGDLHVTIHLQGTIGRVSIHPLSRGIHPSVSGNDVAFALPGPGKYSIQIDSLPPLFLFADSIEKNPVSHSTPGVHYFAPGIHRPGYITLKDNETVYIAPGAIVYGGIRAKGVHNIRVLGRGILDGASAFDQMVLIEDCRDVTVEGVMIRDGVGWTNTLVHCDSIAYRGVKVLSFGPACDGIDPLGSKNVTIADCFLRCTDDCIAIKAPTRGHNVRNVLVAGNVLIGFAFSDGVTIGFETNTDSISDVTVRDCDVLLARGGSRVDGHSGFSIVCDGPATISRVLYENVHVENAEVKLFELNITDGTKYGVGPPGHINDITLKNITWAHEGPIVLKGFDDSHKIQSVRFEKCTVSGKPLREVQEKVLRIGGHVGGLDVR